MVFGVGAFAQGVMRSLREDGARVSAYWTRPYSHYGPGREGRGYPAARHPDPLPLLRRERVDLIVPMAIEWAPQPWAPALLARGVPLLSPTGEGLRIERERDFARALCARFGVPCARAHVAPNRAAARRWVRRHPAPYVLKNPRCSPFSPLHTMVCESVEETLAWLERVDDREGVFLQEYLGTAEAGHIALVADGEVCPLATNQEYKRAFDGNLGIVAGAPLGGIVERDPRDRYGLVRELLLPLRPWFRETGYHGPIQVTAIRRDGRWHAIEYNVRLGVTNGPLILRLLANPLAVLRATAANRLPRPRWRPGLRFGASVTLAGYGYPHVRLEGPEVPVTVGEPLEAEVWWGEVRADRAGRLWATGHRVADVAAVDRTLPAALRRIYRTLGRLRCPGGYYRQDIGRSLWPPGTP